MGKAWYKSKTLWANLAAIVTGVGAIVTGQVSLAAGIPPVVIAAINIVLRIVTKEPIGK